MCNFLTLNHVNGKGSYKGLEEVHKNVYPTCSTAARMYELPKLHKEFDAVPAFRPISSLIGFYCYPLANFLTKRLNNVTPNDHCAKNGKNLPFLIFQQ